MGHLFVAAHNRDGAIALVFCQSGNQLAQLAARCRHNERFRAFLLDDIEHRIGGQRVDDHRRPILVTDVLSQWNTGRCVRNGVLGPGAGWACNERHPPAPEPVCQEAPTGINHFADALKAGRMALDTRLPVKSLDEHEVRWIDRSQPYLDEYLAVFRLWGVDRLRGQIWGKVRQRHASRFAGIAAFVQRQCEYLLRIAHRFPFRVSARSFPSPGENGCVPVLWRPLPAQMYVRHAV